MGLPNFLSTDIKKMIIHIMHKPMMTSFARFCKSNCATVSVKLGLPKVRGEPGTTAFVGLGVGVGVGGGV